MTSLYFAYGSNTSITQMRRRCPRAKPLHRFTMTDCRLVFRGVADVAYEPGAETIGALYEITDECERALDQWEGFNAADPMAGAYRKEYADLDEEWNGHKRVLYYIKNSTGIMPPTAAYANIIKNGYRDHNIPLKQLNDAIRLSWDDKAPGFGERERHARGGYQELARVGERKRKPRNNLFTCREDF